MFVNHSAATGKAAGYSCIIALLQERLLDVSVSLSSYRKVVRCSCIIALLQGRLLDISVS